MPARTTAPVASLSEREIEDAMGKYRVRLVKTLRDVFHMSDPEAERLVDGYIDHDAVLGIDAQIALLHLDALQVAADLAGQQDRVLSKSERATYAKVVAELEGSRDRPTDFSDDLPENFRGYGRTRA